ncbi:beta-glucoside-specific PTS transporter subunit IIABC [Vagococcus fluvialis]|uniref:beta-glucoside-specific PTS transporter subunit IIABC n=1 Tax=Vagococcus fluvialis TaxID=2738 RepID=UPI003B5CA0F0
MTYQHLAKEILAAIGGKDNIIECKHCMTRLRININDEAKIDKKAVEKLEGVIAVVQSGGQFQIVIGNHVSEVYQELLKLLERNESTETIKIESNGIFNRFIDIISSIFTPILGVLAATGMIKGLTATFLAFNWLTLDSGTYKILQATGDSLMYFFPIFLGYTASKKFKLPPFLGMIIGAALVHPVMTGIASSSAEPLYVLFKGTLIESPVYITFLGIPVITMDYGASIIPIVIAIYFASKVYKKIYHIIPSIVRSFLVPLVTLLIVVPLTFLVIGPVATWMGDLLGWLTLTLYQLNPVIAGIIIGGTWQLLVMLGLHWGIIPISINNILTMGFDPILALGSATSFATAGVVLGVVIKTKNKNLKSLGISAFISSLLGVSEPSIYGITLPRKKPFYATLFASAIAGMIIGLFGSKLFNMGGLGIFGIPNYINPELGVEKAFYGYLMAISVAFIVGLLLSLTIAYSNSMDPVIEEKNDLKLKEKSILAPIKGKVIKLSEIEDNIFSGELLGKGVGIIPLTNKVYASANGVVTTLLPTKHGIGLTFDNGIEMLIHIGIDTVNLNGNYFTSFVEQGDIVKQGALLIEFDRERILASGYSLQTPIIITNSAEFKNVIPTTKDKVDRDTELLKIM